MNKFANPNDVQQWVQPPAGKVSPVAGYDAWLAQDIAAGLAEIDAGATAPLADMRKEFGLE